MAGFTAADTSALADRDEACYLNSRTGNLIVNRSLGAIAAAGDLTKIDDGVASQQIVIVGGWLSAGGAEAVDILTGTAGGQEKIDSIQFSAAQTRLPFPKGLHCDSGDNLYLDKGTAQAATGYIEYVFVTEGQHVPIP